MATLFLNEGSILKVKESKEQILEKITILEAKDQHNFLKLQVTGGWSSRDDRPSNNHGEKETFVNLKRILFF